KGGIMVKNLIKKLLLVSILLVFAFSAAANAEDIPQYVKTPKIMAVASAYKAKILCSAVFISKRDPAQVQQEELKDFPFPASIDYRNETVSVTPGFGMPDQVAIFRKGLGCRRRTPLLGQPERKISSKSTY
ncbi:MAG: hypothetical protein ACERK9_13030, partial [Deltaproteobacteria bacterium]